MSTVRKTRRDNNDHCEPILPCPEVMFGVNQGPT
jgi:hypothetical protein